MARELQLVTPGYAAVVYDDDYGRVSQFRWHAFDRKKGRAVYAKTHIKDENGHWRMVYLHRFILNAPFDLFHEVGGGQVSP